MIIKWIGSGSIQRVPQDGIGRQHLKQFTGHIGLEGTNTSISDPQMFTVRTRQDHQRIPKSKAIHQSDSLGLLPPHDIIFTADTRYDIHVLLNATQWPNIMSCQTRPAYQEWQLGIGHFTNA